MPKVTIEDVEYIVNMRRDGVIVVEHTNGQYNPMHGAGTEGVHRFEVHPCQGRWYAHWESHVPAKTRSRRKHDEPAPAPSWSLRSAKPDTASKPMSLGPPRKKGSGRS